MCCGHTRRGCRYPGASSRSSSPGPPPAQHPRHAIQQPVRYNRGEVAFEPGRLRNSRDTRFNNLYVTTVGRLRSRFRVAYFGRVRGGGAAERPQHTDECESARVREGRGSNHRPACLETHETSHSAIAGSTAAEVSGSVRGESRRFRASGSRLANRVSWNLVRACPRCYPGTPPKNQFRVPG